MVVYDQKPGDNMPNVSPLMANDNSKSSMRKENSPSMFKTGGMNYTQTINSTRRNGFNIDAIKADSPKRD